MYKKITRAIVSVTDKSGIDGFVKELSKMGVEIISTGGTAKILEDAGIKVVGISDYTGSPEMLGGRVKTLHPRIHGGILAMRDDETHRKQMDENDILPIDMVVVNLYAFEDTIKKGCSLEEAIENIDIGGPTMLRSAAKNYNDVAVVTDPADYEKIIEEMKANDSSLSKDTRFSLSKKVFQLTARYDGAISNYLGKIEGPDIKSETMEHPETLTLQYKKLQDLRYGENPHQSAAFYSENPAIPGSLAASTQHQGKELSFNNILDIHAALELVREFDDPAAIIIKHNNPCGAAISKEGILQAYENALECDSKSAFGGIVGLNRTVTKVVAEKLCEIFLEAVVAPSYEADALEVFKKKKNVRVLEVSELTVGEAGENKGLSFETKKVSGGVLVQGLDDQLAGELKTATEKEPTEKEMTDLMFAWKICKHVKSNAIIFAKGGRTIGIGAGQMSRIDSTNLAFMKATDAGLDVKGSVMASDAFFPFRDNVDKAAEIGIVSIIQPGGSIRDGEVLDAAKEHDISMVFTAMRHFRH